MPIIPFIEITPIDGIYNSIGFVNTGFPDVNILYRTDPQGNRVCLSKTIGANGAFADFTAASGVQYLYEGAAIYDGTVNPNGSPKPARLTLSNAILHKVGRGDLTNNADTDNLSVVELFNLEGQQTTQSREADILRLAATEKPRIKTAPQVQTIIECPIIIPQGDLAAMIRPFEAMLWSNDLWCFRDPMGELIFCTFPDQEPTTDINLECTIIMWESDYNEHIE
jgi:hypothetical protein